jgi:SH3-like domain-containing protein
MPPRYRVVGVRPDDMLNMRSAPTAKADIIGQIPPDAGGVRRSDICIGEWCQVAYAGRTGWVNRYFLTVVSAVSIPRS